jgi:hypothetical protein
MMLGEPPLGVGQVAFELRVPPIVFEGGVAIIILTAPIDNGVEETTDSANLMHHSHRQSQRCAATHTTPHNDKAKAARQPR